MSGELKSLRLRGDALYYFEDLPAPASDRQQTVLVLHGFPDTPSSFSALGQALAEDGYRVLRPYLPGYAPSTFRGPRGIAEASARLLEFVQGREEPVHLVGHDWGAILSYALLSAQPERFSRAVAISVPHLAHLLPKAVQHIAQIRRSLYILFFQLPLLPERAMGARVALCRRLLQRWSPRFAFPASRLEDIEACIRASGSGPLSYYRDLGSLLRLRGLRATALSTPLLYVHGREDACIDWKLSIGQERFFTGGYSSLLLGCGHFPQLEKPAELAAAVRQWLAD